jgi:hypothetical protein
MKIWPLRIHSVRLHFAARLSYSITVEANAISPDPESGIRMANAVKQPHRHHYCICKKAIFIDTGTGEYPLFNEIKVS